jgi:hypothetical protein
VVMGTPEWAQWTWQHYCAPKYVHDQTAAFSEFLTWLRQMGKIVPNTGGSSLHGLCMSIALSIGILIRDMDMTMGVQSGIYAYKKVPRYVKNTSLHEDIARHYLLPVCAELTKVLHRHKAKSLPSSLVQPNDPVNAVRQHEASTSRPAEEVARPVDLLARPVNVPFRPVKPVARPVNTTSDPTATASHSSTRNDAGQSGASMSNIQHDVNMPAPVKTREQRSRKVPTRYDPNRFDTNSQRSKRKVGSQHADTGEAHMPLPAVNK